MTFTSSDTSSGELAGSSRSENGGNAHSRAFDLQKHPCHQQGCL